MRQLASSAEYNEGSAYEVAQGKLFYRWFNCAGCHAQGGGAIGPALMDDKWIYGKDPIRSSGRSSRAGQRDAVVPRPHSRAAGVAARRYVRSMSGWFG
jgi:cytochrome c oxidase cbb3-type subunit 3